MRYVARDDDMQTMLVPFSEAPFMAQLKYIVHRPIGLVLKAWVAWRKERVRTWAVEQAVKAGVGGDGRRIAGSAEAIAHYIATGEREQFW